MRALRALLLSLILAVSGLTTAGARGRMASPEILVLCTGGGLVTVVHDAPGEPAAGAHTCPECVLSLSIPVAGAPAMPLLAQGWTALHLAPATGPLPERPQHVLPSARGPPAPV